MLHTLGQRTIVRDAEYNRIIALLGDGLNEFRGIFIVGEIGFGKSTLLAAAAEYAAQAGTLVLRARASSAESNLSLSCLHQLLAGRISSSGRLAGAFASGGPVTDADLAAVTDEVVALLSTLCASASVLLVVDDAEHLDQHSIHIMNLIATRLRGKPLTLLLAARNTMPSPWKLTIPTLRLQPLTIGAAARLADVQRHRPTGRTRLRILHEAQGNPLAIVELIRAYGRRGESTSHQYSAPDTARIRQLLAGQLGELPSTTRKLLLYAAAAGGEHLPTSVIESTTHESAESWEPARQAGVVALDKGALRFWHPLARAACYWSATALERQQVHQDLATAFVASPAQRAWHLGQACVDTDETVAIALEDAANAIDAARGICAAASALHRAAECSPERQDQVRRRIVAMTAAIRLGAPAWVRELHAEILARTDEVETLRLAGRHASTALSLSGRQHEAFTLAADIVNDAEAPSQATLLSAASTMSEIAFRSGIPEHRTMVHQVLADSADTADTADNVTKAVVFARAEPRLAGSLSTRLPTPDTRWESSLALGEIAWYADESVSCVEHLQRAFAQLNSVRAPGLTLFCAPQLVSALLDTGRWDEADTVLDEMADRAAGQEIVQLGVSVSALRAELHARRGRDAPATELLRSAWYEVDLDENRAIAALLRRAAGWTALAAGNAGQAYRHYRALFDTDLMPLHYFISHRSICDLSAAANRVDQRSDALRVLEAAKAQLGSTTTRMRLQLHHAEALIGEPTKVEDNFRRAVDDPAAEQWPFDRVMARLHYAEWLRRQRRCLDARTQLSPTLDWFTSLDAVQLLRRSRGELRACIGAVDCAPYDRLDDLTAQQLRIVQLAGQGLRNQEIADQLLISKRTVDAHLRNAYTKLGITNRHQLRRAVEDR